ncbi:MAG: CHAD domain-containing protein [Halomonas sp.]|nr:CHAD domain-containing protein [Halomonas sp.]TVP46069.1 MAG: CHAD domain-containing protein [Halomonas sp.]
MRHLYVMRHAKAKRLSGDMTDHQRPLQKWGKRQARAMAPVLQGWQALEGEIYVSPAARTRETFDQVAVQLPSDTQTDQVHIEQALYTFDGDMLLEWVKALPDGVERALIIGHDPALSDLVRWLSHEASYSLATGSVLHLTLPDSSWTTMEQGGAELAESLVPEEASYRLFKRLAPTPPDYQDEIASRIGDMLEHQCRLVSALEPGVVAGFDPEFLHQYRVNLRRSRAVGESLLAIVKVSGLKKRLKRLKHLGQATSDLRDLDVFLKYLNKSPPPLSARTLEGLKQWLQACPQAQHKSLYQRLSTPEHAEQLQGWQTFIASDEFKQALSKLTPKRINKVLDKRIACQNDDLAALSLDSPDSALHELRKRVKRIRYLADLNPEAPTSFLSTLKHRQSLLGEYQDVCTRQIWLDAFIESSDLDAEQKQECVSWYASLEESKHKLHKEVLGLAPLAS